MSASDVLDRVLKAVGLEATATFADTSFEVQQVVSEINEAGRDIITRGEFSALYVDEAIPAGSSHSLPSDWQEMGETGSIVMGDVLRPITMPEQWAFLSANASTQNYYMVRGTTVYFKPDLTATATMTYVSKNWVEGGKDEFTQDADMALIPERLLALGAIWRWRRLKGLPYDDQLAEFEADLGASLKASRGA